MLHRVGKILLKGGSSNVTFHRDVLRRDALSFEIAATSRSLCPHVGLRNLF